MTGAVIAALAVIAAAGIGLYRWRTDGRFVDRSASAPTVWDQVLAAEPTAAAGERATLLQFSSAFCSPCRATRGVLADVAAQEHGVRHVELDAERHLDLVRRLDVRRTPTTLVLDAAGNEVLRATGAPQKRYVLGALSHSLVGRS